MFPTMTCGINLDKILNIVHYFGLIHNITFLRWDMSLSSERLKRREGTNHASSSSWPFIAGSALTTSSHLNSRQIKSLKLCGINKIMTMNIVKVLAKPTPLVYIRITFCPSKLKYQGPQLKFTCFMFHKRLT